MTRVVVLGLDGFDPGRAEALMDRGMLPHLAALAERGGYARLATTAPPQTPVAWSTALTGANPGVHGIYDFLRRDPASYRPDLALHALERPNRFLPVRAVNRRSGRTVWDRLSASGVSSAVLRAPCTFPPEGLHGRLLAGVGVPDLRGGFGSSAVWVTDPSLETGEGERLVVVERDAGGAVHTRLPGPPRPGTHEDAELPMVILPHGDDVEVRIGRAGRLVPRGGWSDWLDVTFKTGPLQSVEGRVRFHLPLDPGPVVLYASPVNAHPRAPQFPISHPWDYAGELDREIDPYHTTGMAEDHNGLDNGRLDEAAFLRQCGEVLDERVAMLHYELDRFDEGLLYCLFDTPDRVSHMLWRFLDPTHPANRVHGWNAEWADALDEHYRDCDTVVGEVLERLPADTTLMVASDHGFTDFRRQLHLNTWLAERGWLTLRGDAAAGDGTVGPEAVDWSRTRAWAVGLAGVYLNIAGREAQGVVDEADAPALRDALAHDLRSIVDEALGQSAVRWAAPRDQVYRGPRLDEAPDVIVGCAPGYRISGRTALGGVAAGVFADNTRRWSGDHVVDPSEVPGVLFMNRPFDETGPDLTDLTPSILDALGLPVDTDLEGRTLLS